jgi:hypothetical protein
MIVTRLAQAMRKQTPTFESTFEIDDPDSRGIKRGISEMLEVF